MPALIARKGLELACFFEPEKTGLPDPTTFVRINYEGFSFCSAAEKQRFLADPVRYCGYLTDPVSKRRFRPDREAPRQEHEGVLYLFERRATARAFAEAPAEFRVPGYEMEEEDARGQGRPAG